jgi:hypothetical protein
MAVTQDALIGLSLLHCLIHGKMECICCLNRIIQRASLYILLVKQVALMGYSLLYCLIFTVKQNAFCFLIRRASLYILLLKTTKLLCM